MSVIYIAGPMRGYKHYNFPAFDAAKKELESDGSTVISPADLDRDSGFDETNFPEDWDWGTTASSFPLKDAARRDVDAIFDSDAIYLLDGWQDSTGANAELALARWLGLEIIKQTDETVAEEAIRIQGGDRQRDYGHPSRDFARIATMWNVLLGEFVTKDGKLDMPPRAVAVAMIALKMSREVNRHKRDNFVDTIGYSTCGEECAEAEAPYES